MPQRLFLVWILLSVFSLLGAMQIAQEADSIAAEISSRIQTSEPLFLSVNAGEWTPFLQNSLSEKLLARGLDLRVPIGISPDATLDPADSLDLSSYQLSTALLVQIGLNLKWEQHTQKSFFSYHNERRPVYSFEIKQLKLPEQRLISISEYDFIRDHAPETEVSRLRFRWFEPLVASAAIASMIILLWNFN